MANEYDVAILGWWHNSNYGSIMTYYALNRAIIDYGYSTLLVHEALGYPSRGKLPADAPAITFAQRQGFNYTEQSHFSENDKLNDVADTFVVGSDQLWNPYIPRINDDLFLNFTAPEKKRIAYGTSIGNFSREKFQSDHFGPDFEVVQKQNLERFDWISMREDDGIDYFKKTFGFDVPQVVDPVFLIDPQNYHDLASQATRKIEGPYMLAFILDPNEEKRRGVQAVADKLGFDRIAVFTDANRRQLARAKEIFSGPQFVFDDEIRSENWLHAYQNAGYVVTDSFHGSAFSFIFQKPFSSFYNKIRGTNRFASLMRLFKLDDSRRIYEENTEENIRNNPNVSMEIDFSAGNANLAIEREKSHQWLKNAIQEPKKADKTLPGATMFANQKKLAGNELLPLLTKGTFVYYREGQRGEPLAKGVRLSETGDITGIKNSVHSFFWRLEGGRLEFQNKEHQATTIFDVKKKPDGTLDIRGAFIPNKKVIHVLEEEESWNKTAKVDLFNEQKLIAEKFGRDDIARFIGASAPKWHARNIGNIRALMVFYAHALEKGLSHTDFRPGFGKAAIIDLARETNKWVEGGGSIQDSFFKMATSVMRSYLERHRGLDVDVSHYWNLFSPAVQREIEVADGELGGVVPVRSERETTPDNVPERSFIDVAFGRRSVRSFTAEPVAEADIMNAIRIAIQAPSVCNRQPARVYQMSDPDVIKKALEIQVGFRGFAPPPTLLLVTVDLTAYLYAAERNQAYIDGGLFMMLLLLGLEQVGLGACCLNTAMSVGQQNDVRKLLDIPSTDVLIAFAAVGHFDSATLVPRSKRLSAEEIFVRR